MTTLTHNEFATGTKGTLLIPEIGLTEIEGEPLARDLDLADRLGFSRPRDIRSLIERNLIELEGFGPARRRAALVSRPQGGQQEVLEYWLSEEQALLIATLSKATHAPAVRRMLIKTFVAWRRGHFQVSIPSAVIEMITRTQGICKMLAHKVTELEKAAPITLPPTQETVAAAVHAELAKQSYYLRRGKTAGQIWREKGYAPLKGIAGWFGNRLKEMNCGIEDNGRAEMGLCRARLFDPDKALTWLDNGGAFIVKQKIADRQGQGKLRLVNNDE